MHMLLGDLALETERFDSARADYGEGLRLLTSALEVRVSPGLRLHRPWGRPRAS